MIRAVILSLMIAAVVLTPRYVGDRVHQFRGVVSARTPQAGTEADSEEVAEGTLGRGVTQASASGYRPYYGRQASGWEKAVTAAHGALKAAFALGREKRLLLLALNWLFLAATMTLALAAFLLARYTLSRRACQALLTVGSCELSALAVLAIAAHVCRINFFAAVPTLFWLTPTIFILVAVGSLRRIDMNYPFWNETLRALLLPVLAGVIVLEWDRLSAAIHRLS